MPTKSSSKEQLEEKVAPIVDRAKSSALSCLECGKTMRIFRLGNIGLELDFCPRDYNIWFDVLEPERFMKWAEKHTPPPQWQNPSEPSNVAIMAAIYFDGGGFD